MNAKAVMRALAGDARATVTGDERAAAAQALADIWTRTPLIDPPAIIAGFWPIRDEIDIRPLMMLLAANGHQLAMPVVTVRGQPLQFRAWRPADPLVRGPFNTLHPEETRAEVVPDLLLVPLLAVDGDGFRLGYGAGFYDRTLASLRARGPVQAVGVGFEVQRFDEIPHGPGDERLDWLLTEAGLFAFV